MLSGGGGKKSTLGPDFLTTATTLALEFFLEKFQWKFRKQVRSSLQCQRAKRIGGAATNATLEGYVRIVITKGSLLLLLPIGQ